MVSCVSLGGLGGISFDGGGDGLLDQLPYLVGKINDLVKLAHCGSDVGLKVKGAGEVERTIDFFGLLQSAKNWVNLFGAVMVNHP